MEYYQNLSDIISLDKIPDELSFVRDKLDGLLSKIYFDDYIYDINPYRFEAYYSISLLFARLDINLGDFTLIINPAVTNPVGSESYSELTSVPLYFGYKWEILKYLPPTCL